MRSLLPLVVLLPIAALSAVLPDAPSPKSGLAPARRDVSPDNTCGLVEAGADLGYTCPGEAPCCSQYGYCGADDTFCLTSAGCQSEFSNSTAACQEPTPGTTISVDGTCGTTEAGEHGYRCPEEGATCCSAAGYCGNTTDHCSVDSGCQAEFGTCAGANTPRSLVEFM
ncbi:Carbohydrate-binding module family 18 protein [Madurella fahalii]|uniref:Carbohydrate-binding module family 18 protein n=1 Tax=Madurella fahalii TaxID=1157608 RepID=A0ABQ0GFL3_9PEZI